MRDCTTAHLDDATHGADLVGDDAKGGAATDDQIRDVNARGVDELLNEVAATVVFRDGVELVLVGPLTNECAANLLADAASESIDDVFNERGVWERDRKQIA